MGDDECWDSVVLEAAESEGVVRGVCVFEGEEDGGVDGWSGPGWEGVGWNGRVGRGE